MRLFQINSRPSEGDSFTVLTITPKGVEVSFSDTPEGDCAVQDVGCTLVLSTVKVEDIEALLIEGRTLPVFNALVLYAGVCADLYELSPEHDFAKFRTALEAGLKDLRLLANQLGFRPHANECKGCLEDKKDSKGELCSKCEEEQKIITEFRAQLTQAVRDSGAGPKPTQH